MLIENSFNSTARSRSERFSFWKMISLVKFDSLLDLL